MFDTCFPNNVLPSTPCILNFFVWIWCLKHFLHWCIRIFIVVIIGVFIRLCIKMLLRFPIASFKAFVKECECRGTIVVWGESFSQMPNYLCYLPYLQHHCHWNKLVYQRWIWELDCESYLHLPWDHKHAKDWMEASLP